MAEDQRNAATEQIFVFQGGGALGAYQAGAYQALHEQDVDPSWLAGISIGAVNAAIIVGTPREQRIARLEEFWQQVSSWLDFGPSAPGEDNRRLANDAAALASAIMGVPGFFSPRFQSPFHWVADPQSRISFYDTEPLMHTLDRLVDFDLLNSCKTRLSVGAVDIHSGNFAYFDNRTRRLDARHIAASGALPPGFPPVEIDGRYYWDGGLVSNTPLQHVLNANDASRDLEIFQVDLFNARGDMPRDQFEVESRIKEIRYSSRTRMNTDDFARRQIVRRAAKRLLEKLPPELKDDEDAGILRSIGHEYDVTIVHLIHRRASHATHAMDVEFSRRSVEEHWRAGYDDARFTLEHPRWRERGRPHNGIQIFDLARERQRG
ncbi:patatin-like phospholipase family protein [Peteryoungia ipomoeae]|uniref:Patatin-like phospholipase family protein n=1 Tax=Peteryoungia ipomoeae TaxID=1210932 RepID=A0A4S8P1Z9_9HYPH|nr:patatin-like phospholipase family protein [Peteryoungia ipomoeae]THV23321.1 patatin-like phospholipase family protein [Peteryoungia ipomoeae]